MGWGGGGGGGLRKVYGGEYHDVGGPRIEEGVWR